MPLLPGTNVQPSAHNTAGHTGGQLHESQVPLLPGTNVQPCAQRMAGHSGAAGHTGACTLPGP